jgi:hypothetical protein
LGKVWLPVALNPIVAPLPVGVVPEDVVAVVDEAFDTTKVTLNETVFPELAADTDTVAV